jgi:hypothetical protein
MCSFRNCYIAGLTSLYQIRIKIQANKNLVLQRGKRTEGLTNQFPLNESGTVLPVTEKILSLCSHD